MSLDASELSTLMRSLQRAYEALPPSLRKYVEGIELAGKSSNFGSANILLNDVDLTILPAPDAAEVESLRSKKILTPQEAERLTQIGEGMKAKKVFTDLAEKNFREERGRSMKDAKILHYDQYGSRAVNDPAEGYKTPGAADHLHTLEKKKILRFVTDATGKAQLSEHFPDVVVGKWSGVKSVTGIASEALDGYRSDRKAKWIIRVADAVQEESRRGSSLALTPEELALVDNARASTVQGSSAKIDTAAAEAFIEKYKNLKAEPLTGATTSTSHSQSVPPKTASSPQPSSTPAVSNSAHDVPSDSARKRFWRMLAIREGMRRDPTNERYAKRWQRIMRNFPTSEHADIERHIDKQLRELSKSQRGELYEYLKRKKSQTGTLRPDRAGTSLKGAAADHRVGEGLVKTGIAKSPRYGVNDPRNLRVGEYFQNRWRGTELEARVIEKYRENVKTMSPAEAKTKAIRDTIAEHRAKTSAPTSTPESKMPAATETSPALERLESVLKEVDDGIKNGKINSMKEAQNVFTEKAMKSGMSRGQANSLWNEIKNKAGTWENLREGVVTGSKPVSTKAPWLLSLKGSVSVFVLLEIYKGMVTGKSPSEILTTAGYGLGTMAAIEGATWATVWTVAKTFGPAAAKAVSTAVSSVFAGAAIAYTGYQVYQVITGLIELNTLHGKNVKQATEIFKSNTDLTRKVIESIKKASTQLSTLQEQVNKDGKTTVSDKIELDPNKDGGIADLIGNIQFAKQWLETGRNLQKGTFKNNLSSATSIFGSVDKDFAEAAKEADDALKELESVMTTTQIEQKTVWLIDRIRKEYEEIIPTLQSPEHKLEEAWKEVTYWRQKTDTATSDKERDNFHKEYQDAFDRYKKLLKEAEENSNDGTSTAVSTTAIDGISDPELIDEKDLPLPDEYTSDISREDDNDLEEETVLENTRSTGPEATLNTPSAEGLFNNKDQEESEMVKSIPQGNPTSVYQYQNAEGDKVTVSKFANGAIVESCTNGTDTIYNPDGSSESEQNTPTGRIRVIRTPNGVTTIEVPSATPDCKPGQKTIVQDPETSATSIVGPDGTKVEILPGGKVIVTEPGKPPLEGLTWDAALKAGHIKDPTFISTGANFGKIDELRFVCDGQIGCVYLPPGRITNEDEEKQIRVVNGGVIKGTDSPGTIKFPCNGSCEGDHTKPPPERGDAQDGYSSIPVSDPRALVPDIINGAVSRGAQVDPNLMGDKENTKATVEQITRFIDHGMTEQEFMEWWDSRTPKDAPDREKKAQEVWRTCQVYSKVVKNLTKQSSPQPPLPPTTGGTNQPPTSDGGVTGQDEEKPPAVTPIKPITVSVPGWLDKSPTGQLIDATVTGKNNWIGVQNSLQDPNNPDNKDPRTRGGKEASAENHKQGVEDKMNDLKEQMKQDATRDLQNTLASVNNIAAGSGTTSAGIQDEINKMKQELQDIKKQIEDSIDNAFKDYKFCNEKETIESALKGLRTRPSFDPDRLRKLDNHLYSNVNNYVNNQAGQLPSGGKEREQKKEELKKEMKKMADSLRQSGMNKTASQLEKGMNKIK